jgi:hypothetical protein
MYNFIELFQRTNWQIWYDFLSKGNPPLILQLLAINSVIFIFLIIRRSRGQSTLKRGVGATVQGLLILANIAILTQAQLMPIYSGYMTTFWHRLMNVI